MRFRMLSECRVPLVVQWDTSTNKCRLFFKIKKGLVCIRDQRNKYLRQTSRPANPRFVSMAFRFGYHAIKLSLFAIKYLPMRFSGHWGDGAEYISPNRLAKRRNLMRKLSCVGVCGNWAKVSPDDQNLSTTLALLVKSAFNPGCPASDYHFVFRRLTKVKSNFKKPINHSFKTTDIKVIFLTNQI